MCSLFQVRPVERRAAEAGQLLRTRLAQLETVGFHRQPPERNYGLEVRF